MLPTPCLSAENFLARSMLMFCWFIYDWGAFGPVPRIIMIIVSLTDVEFCGMDSAHQEGIVSLGYQLPCQGLSFFLLAVLILQESE